MRFSLIDQYRLVLGMMIVAAITGLAFGVRAETKLAKGTTSAAVVFGPANGPLTLESVFAVTDKADATLSIYSWDEAAALQPTVAPAATNIVYVDNSSLTTNDMVVYAHMDGTLDYRTVSAATTTNVTLSANLSQAGSTSDMIYELSESGRLPFDTTGAGVGTNKIGTFEGPVVWRGLPPVRTVIDGTSNAVLQATSDL